MKPLRSLYFLTGAALLVSALCASKCEHSTEIIPYVKEACNDVLDNDQDGLIDCLDPDCDLECLVHVTLDPVPSSITTDSLTVTGTHFKATGIVVNVSPSGISATAAITGDKWSATLTSLATLQTYTLFVIGSDAQGRRDTVTATVTRRN